MSGSLAIAGITACLRDLLNNGLIDNDLNVPPNVLVSALPPDHIGTGAGQEHDQINVFLYQVTPNPGWRNADLPARASDGKQRLSNPPLALDLHYLVTAYGAKDMNAEILLGYAMQVLHENPGLSREQLRMALQNPTTTGGVTIPGVFGNLSAVDLADQVEAIKITPMFLTTEELSKLWTSMQARYRPSMAYMISVVLIQAKEPVKSVLPVLRRGPDDRGAFVLASPPPMLISVRPALSSALPAMRLGDELLVTGVNLGSVTDLSITLENTDVSGIVERELSPVSSSKPDSMKATLPSIADDPDAMHQWRVGIYRISLKVTNPSAPSFRSNAMPIALAPIIKIDPPLVQPVSAGSEVGLTCTPRLTPQQEKSVRVIFGDQELITKTVTTPVNIGGQPHKPTSITFEVPKTDVSGNVLQPGSYIVRLRVDGIDSIPIKLSGSPTQLSFDDGQKVRVQ